MGSNIATSWTDERVELLKKLWADDLSCSQIAAELGGITRNAVIGKITRLGLQRRARVRSTPRPRIRKPHIERAIRIHDRRVFGPPLVETVNLVEVVMPEDIEIVDNIIPVGQRRTLLQLTEETCRWPIGDPGSADFFFCGGTSDNIQGRPYCGYHSRVAYQPAGDRRRDRRPFKHEESQAAYG